MTSSANLPRFSDSLTSTTNTHNSKESLDTLPKDVASINTGETLPVPGSLINKDPSVNPSGAGNTLGNVAGGILAGLHCPTVSGSSLQNVFK